MKKTFLGPANLYISGRMIVQWIAQKAEKCFGFVVSGVWMDRATGEQSESQGNETEVPVCLRCLEPVDPIHHYCPHCGEATGQLTPYIPFVNIPWQTRIWGQMWRQMWSRDVSVAGRLFRLFMIIWNVPIMLLGLIPALWRVLSRDRNQRTAEPDRENP